MTTPFRTLLLTQPDERDHPLLAQPECQNPFANAHATTSATANAPAQGPNIGRWLLLAAGIGLAVYLTNLRADWCEGRYLGVIPMPDSARLSNSQLALTDARIQLLQALDNDETASNAALHGLRQQQDRSLTQARDALVQTCRGGGPAPGQVGSSLTTGTATDVQMRLAIQQWQSQKQALARTTEAANLRQALHAKMRRMADELTMLQQQLSQTQANTEAAKMGLQQACRQVAAAHQLVTLAQAPALPSAAATEVSPAEPVPAWRVTAFRQLCLPSVLELGS